ncbi:MAG: MerR family transcriptional regulator [Acidiferrobacterales bacterium]|nr:MerR family transcriptional regulator [Acidiferrobacterales bacterium]
MARTTKGAYPTADPKQPRHPIQVVARRTGLTVDVIRAWERRYDAISPTRTETGRRLYSDIDVRRLALLRHAAAAGRRIGDVAGLTDKALAELVAGDEALEVEKEVQTRPATSKPAVGRYLNDCMTAVEEMQPDRLGSALETARVGLSSPVLLEEVITPLIRHIGKGWGSGTLRVAQEHMASAVLLPFLFRLHTSTAIANDGPTVVVATPVRQRHELGALMAAVAAASEGWNVVYLGANLPAEEIAYAATSNNVRTVALSIVYPTDDPQLPDELQRLRTALPDSVALVVGGAAAENYTPILDKIGASQVTDLAQFRTVLRQSQSRRSQH